MNNINTISSHVGNSDSNRQDRGLGGIVVQKANKNSAEA